MNFRPNILILSTDQQRFDALGANGNPCIHTPNLDRLAQRSANFANYFVQNPVCMPSRASFLTGLYPSRLGITENGIPLPQSAVTLPQLLKPYGYTSANLGKLHFLNHANRDHREPHPAYGFDQLEISDEPGVYEDAYRAWVRRLAPELLDEISFGLPPAAQTWYQAMGITDPVRHPVNGPRDDFNGLRIFPGDEGFTHSAFVADRTIEFLKNRRSSSEPFLCIAGFFSPHAPWVVPQRFADLYDEANLPLPQYPENLAALRPPHVTDELLRRNKHGYYASVSEVDDCIGRILNALEQNGQAENTVVVFVSDHGDWMGDHFRFSKGYPGDDAVTHVPFILHIPWESSSHGKTIPQIVEAVDVLPTLLALAGVQAPPSLSGQNLLNGIEGEGDPMRQSALTEGSGWKTLRTEKFRYLLNADGSESLWNLEQDPQGYQDVAGDPCYTAALSNQRWLLLQRLLQAERPLKKTWPY